MATTNSNTQVIAPELLVKDGQVFCTSLQLAHHFDKEHKHVIRDIEEQIAKIQAGRHAGKEAHMFQIDTYPVINNLGHKVNKPLYMLNRAGFIKLVNGYNGQKASDIQMDYIEAFDAMEAALLGKPKPAVERISATQMNHLAVLMAQIERNFHVPRPASHAAYAALRNAFEVESTIQNLPATQFNNALAMTLAMEKAAFAFKCMVMDVEKKFVREVIRNGNGFDRASYEADFDEGIAKIVATRQQQLAWGMAA
ncbi:Rha family transcriptional regulator [Thiothrix winogradskyi]|uniref:Rha family transcriptional regulator n=1 Tax=Thiothrix winogradskyi TaxID=96472 RepID=A0ABY3T327_9GAMM|nr:Rha family transcriptional regulator [Thiothrix winogradskyi]UJS26237.1 Rha family transcriptional regulator [Thiothrix winogradskyi]